MACLPLSIRQILIRSLRGLGISRYSTKAELLSVIVFMITVMPFLDNYDLIGVGYALVVSNTVSLGYLLYILKRNILFAAA